MKEHNKQPATLTSHTLRSLVVTPIDNAYLVQIETERGEFSYSFKSWRQVMIFLKTAGTLAKANSAEEE